MRDWIFLECTVCKDRYYRTSINSKKGQKLELKKYCQVCKAHTIHKERKK